MDEIVRQLLNTYLGLGAPEWLIALLSALVVVGVLFAVAPLQMLFLTYFERRAIARIQDRVGPNRVGPEGVFQPVADGVKMFTKEDIVPEKADRMVHLLAPMVVVAPTLLMFAVVPWGPGMVPIDLDNGLLFFFAMSSVSAVGLLMAGWASNNKFALLGAMRAAAQMISYEIPALLSLLVIVMLIGSMSLVDIIDAQAGLFVRAGDVQLLLGDNALPGETAIPDWGLGWFVFTPVGLLAFICFFIAALAEGERTPFDIPEADSEIVAGYMTEYSGMKFGLFYIAQYLLNFLLCALAAIVFFGGWQFPGINWLAEQGMSATNPEGNPLFNLLAGVLGVTVFLLKTYIFFFFMIVIRGALPRLRVDQLMDFGWKFLIPLTLVNIVSAALWLALTQWGAAQGLAVLEGLNPWLRWGIAFVVTLAINVGAYVYIWQLNQRNRQRPPLPVDEVLATG